MRLYEDLWAEARQLGVVPGADPWDGLEVDLRIARILAHVFAELLIRLGDALDRHALPYMVIGGQAVLVHGEPRLTRDIDITVGVGVDGIDRVLALVAELGLKPLPDDPRAFAVETMVVPALDEASGIRVDLILSFTPLRSSRRSGGREACRWAAGRSAWRQRKTSWCSRSSRDDRATSRMSGWSCCGTRAWTVHYVQHWLRVFEEGSERESGREPARCLRPYRAGASTDQALARAIGGDPRR